MNRNEKTMPHVGGFFSTHALFAQRAVATFSSRGLLRAVFLAALVGAAAMESIRFNMIQPTYVTASATRTVDPIVASVGDEVLRLSDAYAHVDFVGEVQPEDVTELLTSGVVREAADHLALAEAARESGLGNSLDIRAAVALAERQILAEAYLEQIAAVAASNEAVAQRYAEKQAALAENSVMRLSKILVPTKEDADAIVARLPRADFANLARQRSIDEASKSVGGSMGDVRAADLPEALSAAAKALPVGGISAPVKTQAGWVVLKLESRRALRLPPLVDIHASIAAELRQEAMAEAMADARSLSPTRMRDPEAIASDQAEIAGSIAVALTQ
ncbi:MAG: peptidylprolyl isomerase [Pseudomonadota bacterium]